MITVENPRDIYNAQASQWSREEPVLLSDFSARPFLLELCEPIANATVLDLGCGEGYVSRELMKRGARQTFGLDISEKMIATAQSHQQNDRWNGLRFAVADIRNFESLDKDLYDLVTAVF